MQQQTPKRQKKFKVDHSYAYGIREPVQFWYDKHGAVIIGTWSQIAKVMEEQPERFRHTTFETVMPGICMGLGIMMFFYILFSSIS